MENILIEIPEHAENIIKKLQKNGFSAYVVGGCVRDTMQGKQPHDWDICTSALPDDVMRIFADEKVIPTGLKHGTLTLVTGGGADRSPYREDRDSYESFEITTFRSEGGYSDGRHPDNVSFVDDINDDLSRRDFTVNAMAYSPGVGLADPFGGRDDLKAGILRCVGDPDERFREDALRILRALRFMSEKSLDPEPETEAAIRRDYRLLSLVSQERITEEFIKFMCGERAAALLDDYREVFCFIIPELEPMIGFDQRSPYHNRDVWHHTLCAVEDIPAMPVFRLTMLFHDIAKPVVCVIDDNGRGRFQGHPAKGAEMAGVILRRMKLPKKMIEHIVTLIKYHDLKIRQERADVRRWLGRLGRQIFDELMYVRHADASGKYEKYLGEAESKNAALASLRDDIIASGDCTDLRSLAVNGADVAAAGMSGEAIGSALNALLEAVITDRIPNERKALLNEIENMKKM